MAEIVQFPRQPEVTFERAFDSLKRTFSVAHLAAPDDPPAHLHWCGWHYPPRRFTMPGDHVVEICWGCGLVYRVENPMFPAGDAA